MAKIHERMDYAVSMDGVRRRGPKLQMNQGPFRRAAQIEDQVKEDFRAVARFRELKRLESEGTEGPEVDILREDVRRSIYAAPDGKDVSTGGRLGSGEIHSHQSSVNDYNPR